MYSRLFKDLMKKQMQGVSIKTRIYQAEQMELKGENSVSLSNTRYSVTRNNQKKYEDHIQALFKKGFAALNHIETIVAELEDISSGNASIEDCRASLIRKRDRALAPENLAKIHMLATEQEKSDYTHLNQQVEKCVAAYEEDLAKYKLDLFKQKHPKI